MGWTSYFTGKLTSAEKKAELDKGYNWESDKWRVELLKSAMVGSTYYAAVKRTDKQNGNFEVIGEVALTRMEKGEFYYKDMSECSGPYEYKCPKGILELLTPTDNEYAKAWRERVLEYHNSKKEKSFDFNDIIECTNDTGHSFEWNDGFKIEKNEKFFVRVGVVNPYSKKRTKSFVIVKYNQPTDSYVGTFHRLGASSFKNINSKLLLKKGN